MDDLLTKVESDMLKFWVVDLKREFYAVSFVSEGSVVRAADFGR